VNKANFAVLLAVFTAMCARGAFAAAEGAAPSLLPPGRDFRLVWSDEFDSDALDMSKWSFRTNFWGKRAHWFATPEDGAVVVKDGLAHFKIVKRPDGSYCSAQLQTGSLLWDDLEAKSGCGVVWPFRARSRPKFMHRYGYYECRFRLQRKEGWWSAFWLQAPANGATLDPRRSGVECDIMESFEPGSYIVHAFHYNGCGSEYKKFNAQRAPYTPTPDSAYRQRYPLSLDEFHTFGLLWEEDGYIVFVDGRQSGHKVGKAPGEAVSETEQFVLISTELKGFRKDNAPEKEVAEAYAAGDEFVVDYVRVYDCR
jgi:beta-glucanase (GH16 family)